MEHSPDSEFGMRAKADRRVLEEDAASSTDEDGNKDGANERLNYTGGFQAPDTREVIGIALSLGAVMVLAVAAGLTTIFDWVL